MLKPDPIHKRLKLASEEAGYGAGGDSAAARAKLCETLNISPAAVAKLFNGKSGSLKAVNVFAAAELFGVDARWLATGKGEMKPSALPTDVQDVARLLHKLQPPDVRRQAIQMARVVATDPLGKAASLMGAIAEGRRWSVAVVEIADGLEAIEDPERRGRAIAWANRAVFNTDQLPKVPLVDSAVPARRATDRRPAR